MNIKQYFKRLGLALIGQDLVDDYPVRYAQRQEIIDLLSDLPPKDILTPVNPKTSIKNLEWMLKRCLEEEAVFPVDKTGRWIGFVHGVLACIGYLNVDVVRDRSRPRLHTAYRKTGQIIPKTKELENQS